MEIVPVFTKRCPTVARDLSLILHSCAVLTVDIQAELLDQSYLCL